MSRLFICSAGLSLLRSFCEPRLRVDYDDDPEFDNPIFHHGAKEVAGWLSRVEPNKVWEDTTSLADVREELLVSLVRNEYKPEWRRRIWARERRRWAKWVGAELATLKLLEPNASSGDQIKVVCSDSAQSLFCGTLIWRAATDWGWTPRRPGVHVKPIEGVDPNEPEKFVNAMTIELPRLVYELAGDAGLGADDELILVGSGGYKAGIPGFADLLWRDDLPQKRSLVFLYEDSSRAIEWKRNALGMGARVVDGGNEPDEPDTRV